MKEPQPESPVCPRVGQFHKTPGPLIVGHIFHITEIRLGSAVKRLDDLISAAFQFFRMLLQMHDQTPCARRSIFDLINISMEMAQPRRHTADNPSAGYPAFPQRRKRVPVLFSICDTGRFHKEFLDLRACMGFFRRHQCGPHEHTVNRHCRQAVLLRPLAGNIICCTLRCPDTAAGDQDDIMPGTDIRICAYQQVIKAFP